MIIFGSGMIGYGALCYFGEENVECFCDNNPALAGTKRYGKDIISFEKLKRDYKDSIIMIAVIGHTAYDIARQCEENGILDYQIFGSPAEAFGKKEYTLEMMSDPINRKDMRRKTYVKRINELERQVEYFKHHADIRHMKPARGAFRTWQLDIVRASAELFQKLSGLDIHPILCGGNLLGYIRHNGFIPWDDDIDFMLMRDEYEKLRAYCREHILPQKEFLEKQNGGKALVCSEDGMEDCCWLQLPDVFKIIQYRPDGRKMDTDFFPLDYYAEDYSFEELKKFTAEVRERFILCRSMEESIRCKEEAEKENRKNTRKESDHIYFGIDNMDIMDNYRRGDWIPKEVMFPLKRALYEGEYFWIPNKPEKFIEYEYSDAWEFPDDVGLKRHFEFGDED